MKHWEEQYSYYKNKLGNIKGILFLEKKKFVTNNYAYMPVLITNEYGKSRNELYTILRSHGIYARKYFYPITADQECFRGRYANVALENARAIAESVLVLPFYEGIKREQIDKIISLLEG